MVSKLYVATSNPGKLREFAVAAIGCAVTILPLPALEQIKPPLEDQPTFAGNAALKAIYYSRFLPRELVLADDSGLEVEALGGAPGVRSARYADDAAMDAIEAAAGASGTISSHGDSLSNDERNNRYLLAQIADIPPNRRQARFRCSLAAARDGWVEYTANGDVEGRILNGPRGSGGFGYDPLFYLPHLALTMAELDLLRKSELSHRGKALCALLAQMV